MSEKFSNGMINSKQTNKPLNSTSCICIYDTCTQAIGFFPYVKNIVITQNGEAHVSCSFSVFFNGGGEG